MHYSEKTKLIDELKLKKNTYEAGKWNPHTVFLGGLGKEPELDDNSNPVKIFERSLERAKPKTKKIDLFKPSSNEADSIEKYI